MIAIGITGVPGNLFDGFLNDAFLAFQLVENYGRRVEMGPYSRHELFTPTASAPYNIESMFTMVNQFLIPVVGGRRLRVPQQQTVRAR